MKQRRGERRAEMRRSGKRVTGDGSGGARDDILSGVLTQSGHSAVPLALLALAIAAWPTALALRLLADRL
jgi:hypothetical protein